MGRSGILLYGTNAVGKTSLIRALGIAVIMAQSGLFVPCSQFTFKPYNYIFTRILGNDNIFKGLSTFAVEMSELRTILKSANSNSLILGDELCSGTETTSALSIFVASLERLHTLESTFLFATHFHEVLDYEEVKNLNKKSNQELIEYISSYFKCGLAEADNYINILPLEEIKNILFEMGVDEKDHKKLIK